VTKHGQVASITGLSGMNGGYYVTCGVRSQDGALFAALCGVCVPPRAGCGVHLLCKHVVGLSELAHVSESSERRRFSATIVAVYGDYSGRNRRLIDYSRKCGQD